MSIPPLVSVVMPAYNVERFLAEAVGSVRSQTWKQLELIIVNDGSTDGTAELAAQFEAEDARIRVVHKQNGGLCSARNAGAAATRGDLLCFLDADDVFLPDKLERQIAFLDFFRSCDVVYSDHYVGNSSLNPLLLECKRPPDLPMQELLIYCNWFAPFSPLMRAPVFTRAGGFDEDLRSAEDWDFWIRVSRCAVLGYLPGPVGVYRNHADQMSNDLLRMRSNQDEVIRKHYETGSREWRITRAARAWSEAKRSKAAGKYGRMSMSLFKCVWHARSRRTLRNVIRLAY